MKKTQYKIEYVDISKLKEHPKNPRKVEGEKFKQLVDSIKKDSDHFEARPLLVNKKNIVFAGNMRLRAARELKLKEVPVIYMDLTAKQEERIMIKDNRHSGTFDWDALSNTFDTDDLFNWGFEPEELGMSKDSKTEIDRDSLADTMGKYMEGNIKQIVLYFDAKQFADVIPRLDNVMKVTDTPSHTEAFLALLDDWEKNQ